MLHPLGEVVFIIPDGIKFAIAVALTAVINVIIIIYVGNKNKFRAVIL